MTDPQQIPHLIKLLDDESADVREMVSKELLEYGSNLKEEIQKMKVLFTPLQKECLDKVLEEQKKKWLCEVWPHWFDSVESLAVGRKRKGVDYVKLEGALTMLSEFLSSPYEKCCLASLLDELASSYKVNFDVVDPGQVAHFLFKEKGLLGDEENYYNPQNSNLAYVIREKKGIPISLTAVYMLVGSRLGLRIEGCHFPGHFLARVPLEEGNVFIDCFNSGRVIQKQEILKMREEVCDGIEYILNEQADTEAMVRRFMASLIRAYQVEEDLDKTGVLIELFNELDARVANRKIAELTPDEIIHASQSRFKVGECVCHRRYGYRGVVVAMDSECKATDDWYYGNHTQPSRHQFWYHILVHETDQVTYVAENNIIPDESAKKVKHPLLSYFFTTTKEGRYVRNDKPWPETDF